MEVAGFSLLELSAEIAVQSSEFQAQFCQIDAQIRERTCWSEGLTLGISFSSPIWKELIFANLHPRRPEWRSSCTAEPEDPERDLNRLNTNPDDPGEMQKTKPMGIEKTTLPTEGSSQANGSVTATGSLGAVTSSTAEISDPAVHTATASECKRAQSPQIDTESPSAFVPDRKDGQLYDEESFLDEVIGALDASFDEACASDSGKEAGHRRLNKEEQAAVRQLFEGIASSYAAPLKNLIFALQRQTAPREMIRFSQPVVSQLKSAALNLELPDILVLLERLQLMLERAQNDPEPLLAGHIRNQILSSYEELAESMPEAFQIDAESQKREDLIIQALLQQVSGLGRAALKRLYQSGLGSLQTLLMANPEDLAAATGIQRKLCERLCTTLSEYREQARQRAAQDGQAGHVLCLSRLADHLSRFASIRGRAMSRKRQGRRTVCLLEIQVILAEMGEFDLIASLRKGSLRKRLQKIDEYLMRVKTDVAARERP